jgi:hypothetical protein
MTGALLMMTGMVNGNIGGGGVDGGGNPVGGGGGDTNEPISVTGITQTGPQTYLGSVTGGALPLTYLWEVIAGEISVSAGETTPEATFTGFVGISVNIIKFTATDDNGAQSAAAISITESGPN